jgi:site-specific DNA-methyltransferase (adenine-specific)
MTYNPQMMVGKPYTKKSAKHKASHYSFEGVDRNEVNTGTRFPVDVLDFPNRNGKSYHPTQKPVEPMDWLVRTYTNNDELVVDPFAGAGSTLLACARSGRQGFGMMGFLAHYGIRLRNNDVVIYSHASTYGFGFHCSLNNRNRKFSKID